MRYENKVRENFPSPNMLTRAKLHRQELLAARHLPNADGRLVINRMADKQGVAKGFHSGGHRIGELRKVEGRLFTKTRACESGDVARNNDMGNYVKDQ